MEKSRDGVSGKTCAAPFHRTAALTSKPYSTRCDKSKTQTLIRLDLTSGQTQAASWQTVTVSPGGFWTLNSGEFPNADAASTLSQILEVNVPSKYFLSSKACEGIIRRAQARGKELPPLLKAALEQQASASTHTTTSKRGGVNGTLRDNCGQANAFAVIMYDGEQVTNKTNASNPQKGGPCHSLCAGNASGAYCVKETPVTLKMRDGCAGGGKGPLIQNDKSATLATQNDQTLFVPCAWNGEQTAPTLTANNAGGGQRMPDKDNFNAVITQKAFAVDQGGGKSGVGVTENKAPTLATTHDGAPAVAYGIDRATFNSGKNAQFKPSIETETQPTLTERGPGGVAQQMTNNEPHYIVRRLTPTECARLQGFPDWWTKNLDTPEPTDEDIAYWREVFETHRRVTGAYSKPKTDAQIAKWLKAPHSDSAEYKMWGNGVALPCVAFVLAAIAYCDEQDKMA